MAPLRWDHGGQPNLRFAGVPRLPSVPSLAGISIHPAELPRSVVLSVAFDLHNPVAPWCSQERWKKGATVIMSKRKVVAPAATTENAHRTSGRYDELKRMLEDRRREILSEVQSRIKDVRSDHASGVLNTGVVDAEESSVSDFQSDIELSLIQMKAETLNRINEALERLEEESYGLCNDCGEEISERRLRALPFAIRCKDCEEARENAQLRDRQMAQRRSSAASFLDMSS